MLYFKHASQVNPWLAGQWLTQMSYEKRLRIQKECGWPYDFCGVADYVGQGHSLFNIHHRAMKLCIHN